MGILVWDAGKAEHLDAFVRFVGMFRADRVYAILARNGTEVVLRPRVQSRIDSAVMRGMTEKTWAMLKESLNSAKLEIIEANLFSWDEDHVPSVDP